MEANLVAAAVAALVENRKRPGPFGGLPEGCNLPDEGAAYDLQGALHGALSGAGFGERTGFKIGCTSLIMQQFLGIDHPCAGGIFENTVHAGDAVLPYGDFHRVGVECEVAVRLGRDVTAAGAPYDRASIAEHVSAVMAAIEIVDDRYADFNSLDTPTLVADDFFNAGAVLGAEIEDWHSLDLAGLQGRTLVNGHEAGAGTGADILGHPLEVLAWFANHRMARDETLVAGEFVSLGSMVQVQWLQPGDKAVIEIDQLGTLSAEFTA